MPEFCREARAITPLVDVEYGVVVEKAGLVLSGVALSSGIGATFLVMSNLLMWAVIAALIGSVAAFAGFAFIVIALSMKDDGEEARRGQAKKLR